jgi:PAT family beta-lactamase induction signal transducer AmpG
MQLIMAVAFAAIAFVIPNISPAEIATGNVGVSVFTACLVIFWIVGFVSATHDIAADGYYMLALDESEQSFFVGIRSTFYRLATIFGQGGLVVLAGLMQTHMGNVSRAWSYTFIILSVLFFVARIYHSFILPRPAVDKAAIEDSETNKDERMNHRSNALRAFFGSFGSFFKKPGVLVATFFILLFRLPEAQLIKIINPFLLDPLSKGGLGLSTTEVGVVYGTIGVIGLTLGGIIGGICASRGGLKKWLWPMALSISLTCITFCYLSITQAQSLIIINLCVFVEQFGYGFGFTAFMLYMMYFSDGEYKTSHYAICTGFMALGMMLPGMAAGWIQEHLGYVNFFWWVFACNIATWIVTALIKVDPEYGKKVRTVPERVNNINEKNDIDV